MPANAGAQNNPPKDGGRYYVFYHSDVLIEPATAFTVGEDLTFKDDDEIVGIKFGPAKIGRLKEDLRISYLSKEAFAPAGTMISAVVPFGGDISSLDRIKPTYCLPEVLNMSRGLGTLLTLGITDITATLDRQTQFCMSDKDNDGRLETGFMLGVRNPEFRKQFAITPVAVEHLSNYQRSPLDVAHIRYHVGTMFSKPRLTLLFGSAISSPVWKIRSRNADGLSKEFKTELNFDKGAKLPKSYDFLTFRFQLLEMSSDQKTIKLRFETPFRQTPFCVGHSCLN